MSGVCGDHRRAGTGPAGLASAGPIIANVFVFFPL